MGLTGYYQRPTIQGDTLIFIYEDDLWMRDLSSQTTAAIRLTANPGRALDPHLSPDGKHLAYTSQDEGHPEVYVTHIEEMEPRRLTYLGEDTRCIGWSRDGANVLFATSAGSPFNRMFRLAQVPAEGGLPSLSISVQQRISVTHPSRAASSDATLGTPLAGSATGVEQPARSGSIQRRPASSRHC